MHLTFRKHTEREIKNKLDRQTTQTDQKRARQTKKDILKERERQAGIER